VLRTLLICGLLAGLCGGLLATGFAGLAGEPAVNQAIAYEEARTPPPPPGTPAEPELVSRDLQSTAGLLTAAGVYGLALGGLFALAFAWAYGRVSPGTGPARTALWLAAIAFAVVYVVPFLKYPPNPPAVGDPDTIGRRTALYLAMTWISIFGAIAAVRTRRLAAERWTSGTATLAGLASFLVIVVVAGIALPSMHEIPRNFPATTLWRFREASFGMQATMWATIGLVFAGLAPRAMSGRSLVPWRDRTPRTPALGAD
jgi:Probable cobalt transporter subunit (CbtA)